LELLSDRERRLIEALARHKSVKDAAYSIRYHESKPDANMTAEAAYHILHRVRRKYLDARKFINTVLAYRQRSDLLKKVLTPAVKQVEEKPEEEEEEEEA